ncbi:MAG: thiolase family protein [Firmicutes bacterium]|nr:thiolase family protein [Bacillota bacterium]
MKNAYIVEACRTAVGKHGGTLKDMQPEVLGTFAVKAAIERSGINPADLDEVIFGHCRQSSHNPNIARVMSLMAGIPEEVPSYTVMRQCASGMTAIADAAMGIMSEQYDLVMAGGVESMSTAPFYIMGARYGLGTGNAQIFDSLTEVQKRAQPMDKYGEFNMGMTAENIAEKYGITREEQERFALQSQERAAAAIASGRFDDEIIPVLVPQRKADPIEFKVDEFPKATSLEKLAKLKPAFRFDGNGTVTAGTSSGRNDGASALILASEEAVEKHGLKPMARIVAMASAGVDPRYMGLGPIPATRKALEKAGLTLDDIGLIELNEAFAAQSIACIKELGLNEEIVNVNGGAIALGHPVGSSGARIVVTLVHEMKKRGVKYGLATLCIAGGLGQAIIVEAL